MKKFFIALSRALEIALQSGYGQLLGFRFHFDRERPAPPRGGRIVRVNVIVMAPRLRSGPAFQRTGHVKQRFAFLPRRAGGGGPLLHGQVIGQTPVMVRVIDERHAF